MGADPTLSRPFGPRYQTTRREAVIHGVPRSNPFHSVDGRVPLVGNGLAGSGVDSSGAFMVAGTYRHEPRHSYRPDSSYTVWIEP
jgi:hypothetical protein